MRRLRAAGLAIAMAGVVVAVGAQGARGEQQAPPGPLPPEVFFGHAPIGEAGLSPSGRWLAIGTRAAGARAGLTVIDLQGAEPPRAVAGFADIDIGHFEWVGDERLVFNLFDGSRGSGIQRYGPGLFSVRRDGSELRQLILRQWWRNPSRGTAATRLLEVDHFLLHVPDEQQPGAEAVIVGQAQFTRDGDYDTMVLKRLDVASGRVQALNVAAPPHVKRWIFDRQGEPRLGRARHRGVATLHRRVAAPDGTWAREWQEIQRGEATSLPWTAHSLDGAGQLYVSEVAGPAGERVLKRFDAAAGAPEPWPLVQVPGFDFVGGLVTDRDSPNPLGVRVQGDAETTVWLDSAMAEVQKAVDTRLPGRVNRLECRRCRHADRVVLVRSFSDRQPGELWLWRGEPRSPSVWRRISAMRPAVDENRMAELVFQRYSARDGRSIPLWVTLPRAVAGAAASPAPAVVLVHGGPWVRGGHWGWDALPQFLASRGYVVLEPEFRGSTGYGDAHFRAGWKQWGRAMQDDLVDAVQWAAGKGVVDTRRVCIAGGSYGGYAALMGLVRHPEQFRCGAAWVAVTEPGLLFKDWFDSDSSEELRAYLLPQLLADPDAEQALLREISPVQQAARIRAPLLLAWGDEDGRVPKEHSERMLEALKREGRAHEHIVYEGEGHSWRKTQTWLDFAQRLERLLERELKAAPPASR